MQYFLILTLKEIIQAQYRQVLLTGIFSQLIITTNNEIA